MPRIYIYCELYHELDHELYHKLYHELDHELYHGPVFEMRGGQGGLNPPKCAKDPGIYAF